MNRKGFTLLELICLILALSICTILITSKIIQMKNSLNEENYKITSNLIKKSIELEFKNNPEFKLEQCNNKDECNNKTNNQIYDISNVSSLNIYISSIKEEDNNYKIKLNASGKYSDIKTKSKTITVSK